MAERKSRPCAVCMQMIDLERLEAASDTRLCLVHAKEIEQYGGEFIRTTSTERTSKPGSLKRNYGGISTKKRRNYTALERLQDAWREKQQSG